MIIYNSEKGIGTSTLFDQRIFHGFGTKKFGNGTNEKTIVRLIYSKTIERARIVIPQQIHSTTVRLIDNNSIDQRITHIPDVDALVTKEKNIILTVVTADCVPIIYADIERSVIGISHGGWSGTLHNIIQNVIDQMIKIGARKKHIVVAIGPAISDCCYEIYGKRHDDFKKKFTSNIITSSGGKYYLNLLQANRELLLSTGIERENIDHTLTCTECDDARFWSYHRNRTLDGEMVHFVMLR